MDGSEKTLKHSLQFRLSAWLAATIIATAIAAGIFSFAAAFEEAHELQDNLLRQVASLVGRGGVSSASGDVSGAIGSDEELRITVQDLSESADEGDLPIPSTLKDGMHTLQIAHEPYRVFVSTSRSGKRLAVAQETDVRDETARDSAVRALLPLLILLPVLLILTVHIVRTMLKPISVLSDELHGRGDHDLAPIVAPRIPGEIAPFVTAINALLDRVKRSMDAQGTFVANAAHELRSPMTALSLQAERMADADMSDTARTRLAELRNGIERGRGLLNQLLALARVQLASPGPGTRVFVNQLYREVLEDLMPLAEQKSIDIGIETTGEIEVVTSKPELASVVRNIVDNAIRYAPVGGRVDLTANRTGDIVVLSVRDTGPGIPESEREKVFDPFYRVLGSGEIGSGLGLSIVKTIAEHLGIEVGLEHQDKAAASGLTVTLTIRA